jgi:predicted membrane-bound spermidine synthase
MPTHPSDVQRTEGQEHRTRFPSPALLVFFSSACIMVLELVAGRIVAPYIGVSIFAWTSVIGVVLAGVSLGNTLGGRLADRWASPRLLGILLALSGLASLTILAVDVLGRFSDLDSITLETLPLFVALGALTVLLFFIPCTILGALSPVVARLAVRDLAKTGSTVGRIYAAGSVGSIVGTFLTGFWLISRFGTHAVVWGAGMLLVALGLLLLVRSRWLWALPALLLLAGAALPVVGPGWLHGPCTRETNYFCIQVRDEEHGGDMVRVLYLDRLLHSFSSLDDPTRLLYDYEQMYAEATAYQAQRQERALSASQGTLGESKGTLGESKGQLRALFIGGGGYTFPRYMEAVYPDSELHVIEIDPGVTEIAYEMLGLDRDTRIVTYNEDARMFLARAPLSSPLAGSRLQDTGEDPDSSPPGGAYDLIMGDAFNDFSVPYHLTTVEFNDRVHAWLAEDGLYVVNIIDGPWGTFLRSYTHTLRQCFRHVYLAIDIDTWRRSTRSTLVLIATDTPLDLAAFESIDAGDGDPQLARLLIASDQIDALLAEGRTVTLTDRYAPVDQMLIPVFLDRVPR